MTDATPTHVDVSTPAEERKQEVPAGEGSGNESTHYTGRKLNFEFTHWNHNFPPLAPDTVHKEVKRCVWQLEKCPSSGRLHLQGYIEFNDGKTWSAVKKWFTEHNGSTTRFRPRAGTAETAWNYCQKSDTCVDVKSRFIYGDPPRGARLGVLPGVRAYNGTDGPLPTYTVSGAGNGPEWVAVRSEAYKIMQRNLALHMAKHMPHEIFAQDKSKPPAPDHVIQAPPYWPLLPASRQVSQRPILRFSPETKRFGQASPQSDSWRTETKWDDESKSSSSHDTPQDLWTTQGVLPSIETQSASGHSEDQECGGSPRSSIL